MSLESLEGILSEIFSSVDIGSYDALSAYDPGDLKKTAEGFDRVLQDYLREYEKAGIKVKRYADADAFAEAYLEAGSDKR